MRGVSRTSFAELRDRLPGALAPAAGGARGAAGRTDAAAASAEQVGDELFAVLRLLDREHALRRALADPAKRVEEKAAVTAALFHGKVSAAAEELTTAAVRSRWASPADMTDAIEQLAAEALAAAAEARGELDDLEDELFRFGRVIAGEPELRAALAESAVPPEGKRALLGGLLEGKVTPVALRLISEMALHPRGRSLTDALELCTRIAAQRRERLIAVVRVARDLTPAQRSRLAGALAANYGHQVSVNVIVDPAVTGGMTIQIGDELIDASVASRLAAVRRRLAG